MQIADITLRTITTQQYISSMFWLWFCVFHWLGRYCILFVLILLCMSDTHIRCLCLYNHVCDWAFMYVNIGISETIITLHYQLGWWKGCSPANTIGSKWIYTSVSTIERAASLILEVKDDSSIIAEEKLFLFIHFHSMEQSEIQCVWSKTFVFNFNDFFSCHWAQRKDIDSAICDLALKQVCRNVLTRPPIAQTSSNNTRALTTKPVNSSLSPPPPPTRPPWQSIW